MTAPTPDEMRAHSHPDTGGGGYWIARVSGRPVVVRLWDAGHWDTPAPLYPGDDETERSTWQSGDLLGACEFCRGTADDVLASLCADAWWRWCGEPVPLACKAIVRASRGAGEAT